jgi:hypothetical protein
MAEARSALRDPVMINPYNSYDTFRCWLIVKQGTTDLTDTSKAIFISAGKLGMVDAGSGSIGGSGGEVNTASNIGTSGTGLYKQKIGVDLQFKNIQANSSKISITEDLPNYLVNIDVGTLTNSDVGLGNVQNLDQTNPANITQDATHRFATDTEKSTWNGKQNALGYTPENVANIRTTFQVTPDDTHYPSEKLVKDSLNLKLIAGANPAYFTPAAPTNLTSSSYLMFGLGGTIHITPLNSGKVRFTILFYPSGIGTNGLNNYKIAYGTGAAPANAAAATGTIVGGIYQGGAAIGVSSTPALITRDVIITGLSVSTAYWFDVQGAKYSTNTSCGMSIIEATLEELPY